MSQQDATFYAYDNSGLETLGAGLDATVLTYFNSGFETLPYTQTNTSSSYLNVGFESAQQTTIVRGPHGWGMISTGSQTIVVMNEQSKATAYTYENVS